MNCFIKIYIGNVSFTIIIIMCNIVLFERYHVKEPVLLRVKRFTTPHNTTLFRQNRTVFLLLKFVNDVIISYMLLIRFKYFDHFSINSVTIVWCHFFQHRFYKTFINVVCLSKYIVPYLFLFESRRWTLK